MRQHLIAAFVIGFVLVFCLGFTVGYSYSQRPQQAAAAARSGDMIPLAACEAQMDAAHQSCVATLKADSQSCVAAINKVTTRCDESMQRIADLVRRHSQHADR